MNIAEAGLLTNVACVFFFVCCCCCAVLGALWPRSSVGGEKTLSCGAGTPGGRLMCSPPLEMELSAEPGAYTACEAVDCKAGRLLLLLLLGWSARSRRSFGGE